MTRPRLRLLALTCGVLPVALSAGTAHASWSTSGTSTAPATTATLVAGTAPTLSQAGATLSLAWTAASAPAGSVPTYALEREVAGSGAWSTVCAASTARTCTHTPAQDGTYDFRVRVALGSWTALSAVSPAATVTVFVAAPTTPVLAAGEDTGPSATDGVTSVAVPHATGSAPAGSTVLLLIDGVIRASQVLAAAQTGYSLAVPLPDGTYQFTVRASRNGTSSALSGALTVTVDTAAPALTGLTRQGQQATKAATVAWTATFSEPVSGVDVTDFALISTGLTGIAARPSGVASASPVSFTVSAGTGAGDGVLGITSVGDGTITDLAGNSVRGQVVGEPFTVDRTAPQVLGIKGVATGDAATDGDVEVGDTVEVLFDEAMGPVPTGQQTLTLSRANGRAGTLAAISGLSAPGLTFDPGGDYNSAKSTVTVVGVLSLSADLRTVVFTVGQQVGCTAKGKKTVCATVTGAAAPVTGFLPAATLTDLAGNGAAQTAYSQPVGTATLLF